MITTGAARRMRSFNGLENGRESLFSGTGVSMAGGIGGGDSSNLRAAECVTQHTLFRKETRWPGYYYRGDAMKVDDANWHVLTVSRRDPESGEYTMEKAPCYHLV